MRRTSTSLDAFWPHRVFIQGGGVYTGWLAMFAHKSFRLQNAFQLRPVLATIRGLNVEVLQEWSCDRGLEISGQTIIEISGICAR